MWTAGAERKLPVKCSLALLSNHSHINIEVLFKSGIQTPGNLQSASCIWGGADKSLARPGRKKATATKLGIYSTWSTRSSIHFLARCSNLCKPLKKKIQNVRPTRSPRQQWPPRRTKNGDLSIVLSFQGTGGSPTGPDRENRVGDQVASSDNHVMVGGTRFGKEWGCLYFQPPHHARDFFPWCRYSVSLCSRNLTLRLPD